MTNSEPLVITGMGIISSQGSDKESFSINCLREKKPTICSRTVEFFDKKYQQKIYDLSPFEERVIPPRMKRRMSQMSRMVAVCALSCLEDAHIDRENLDENMGIVIGTGLGEHHALKGLLSQVKSNPSFISPTLFHNSVHNAPASYLGMILGIKGPTLTVSQQDHTFENALATACPLITNNGSALVLVGACDVFFDFGVIDKTKKKAAVFSSGSYFFLLESESNARKRNAKSRTHITLLPSRKLSKGETVSHYASEIVSFLELKSQKLSSIDLVFLVGISNAINQGIIVELLSHLFSTPVYVQLYTSLHSNPSQGGEYLALALVLLEKQRFICENLRIFHKDFRNCSIPKRETKKILFISLSEKCLSRAFLMEK